jgi:hypothetical protein
MIVKSHHSKEDRLIAIVSYTDVTIMNAFLPSMVSMNSDVTYSESTLKIDLCFI